jgi:hypothetical protein
VTLQTADRIPLSAVRTGLWWLAVYSSLSPLFSHCFGSELQVLAFEHSVYRFGKIGQRQVYGSDMKVTASAASAKQILVGLMLCTPVSLSIKAAENRAGASATRSN